MKPIQSTGYSINFNENAYEQLDRYLSNDQISTIFVLVIKTQMSFATLNSKRRFQLIS